MDLASPLSIDMRDDDVGVLETDDVYVVRDHFGAAAIGFVGLLSLAFAHVATWPWHSLVLALLAVRAYQQKVVVDTQGVELTGWLRTKRLMWTEVKRAELTDGWTGGRWTVRLHTATGDYGSFAFRSRRYMTGAPQAATELYAVIQACLQQLDDEQARSGC